MDLYLDGNNFLSLLELLDYTLPVSVEVSSITFP